MQKTTENDTFNALRRPPFEVLQKLLFTQNRPYMFVGELHDLLSKHGWNVTDYYAEQKKRFP